MNQAIIISEEERIAALRSYQILDSQPEEEYDDLTKLASQICQTPISLISLIDENRQWFKSSHGLSIRQTHRELSFCRHAIVDPSQTMVVNDSRTDKRFAHNPLVTGDPHVIFYAGAPLVDSSGYVLGTFCVIDHTPKQLTQQQLSSLRILAKQVVRLFEARRLQAGLNTAEFGFEQKLKSLISQHTQHLSKANQALSELNRKVTQDNNDLRRSNQSLEQYAYIAAHDLQEPLRKIKAFGDLIFKRHAHQLGEGAEYLSKIQSAARRMSQLVDDLLALSKISANRQVDSLISLDSVIQTVLHDLELAISETGARVESDPLPMVEADHTHFCQVFQNLISNALKFKKQGMAVQINIRYTKIARANLPAGIQPGRICENYHLIQIQDNGIGFDQDQASKIFQLFARLHSTSEIPGTGIGLAICEKIISSYQGAISAQGQKGKGALFSIYLPFR
jgi:signal transduction histidine kinase